MANDRSQVLLVEDDPSTRMLCARTLERSGWSCRQVGTAREAVDLLRSDGGEIDLVVLDYGLPDGEPWPVLEAAQSAQPQIPVVMATGMGDEQVAAECLRRGAADYIIKGGQFWDLLPQSAEHALTMTEAVQDASRLTAVVEASPDPIISIDPAGLILTWNPAATRLYRYPPQEVIGRPFELLVPEEDRAHYAEHVERVREGRRVRSEVWRRAADGEMLPVYTAMSAIVSVDHRLMGIAITEQDLRPRLEAARLQRQAGELEKLNRELDQFAAIAAHDLQAPLRVASLSLDMLQAELGDDLASEPRRLVESALEALRTGSQMVRKILEYARQASVDLAADRTLDADTVCAEALRNLDASIRESGAEIRVQPLGTICFDPTQLMRIFQNIIGNAIKYAHPERPPRIEVRRVDEAPRGFAAIEIEDNGAGMDQEVIANLFVIFHRGGATDGADGTGIGLAVCKKLVEARGGAIGVRSTPGEGSCFRIELPVPSECDDDTSASGNTALQAS